MKMERTYSRQISDEQAAKRTIMAEKDAILWKLSMEDLARLEEQHPDLMRDFLHLVLKGNSTPQNPFLTRLLTGNF